MYKFLIIIFFFLLIFISTFMRNPDKPIDHFNSFNPYTCKYYYDSHNKQYKPFMCDLFN